ncbi:uncharacterized protein Hap1MRO34_003376 [Clarias gariepinus]|uniref:lymphocyte antigen-6, epidermis n=1 Tax=Clarias gariepinus TaxID=13013 RepID=UPI00234C7DCA|nr:lymphocyte antigen-6, epidermis [Clarias gariepinus]
MKRVLLGFVTVIGLFALAESLNCNQCSLSLIGVCLFPTSTTCTTNTSVCTTSKASFSGVSGFLGFGSQGCIESSKCNTTSGTILGATYTVTQTCCSTNTCNPVTVSTSGASYVQLSLTGVLSATLLACVWGQSVY